MPDEKPQKRPRKIPDAGERTVLVAIEVDSYFVAHNLAEQRGIDLKGKSKEDIKKALKPILESLGVNDGGGITVWAKLGQVKADTREEAILEVLGGEVPGDYRAPNASAWRGGKRYKQPTQVALEVEDLD